MVCTRASAVKDGRSAVRHRRGPQQPTHSPGTDAINVSALTGGLKGRQPGHRHRSPPYRQQGGSNHQEPHGGPARQPPLPDLPSTRHASKAEEGGPPTPATTVPSPPPLLRERKGSGVSLVTRG